MDNLFLTKEFFTNVCGVSSYDFDMLVGTHAIIPEDGKFSLAEVVDALFAEKRKLELRSTAQDKESLDREKRHEEILKIRIENQRKMGVLIPREDAKNRMRTAFLAVASKIRFAIKSVAPRLVMQDNPILIGDILTESYNNAMEELYEQASNETWEEDGTKAELGRTVLAEDS